MTTLIRDGRRRAVFLTLLLARLSSSTDVTVANPRPYFLDASAAGDVLRRGQPVFTHDAAQFDADDHEVIHDGGQRRAKKDKEKAVNVKVENAKKKKKTETSGSAPAVVQVRSHAESCTVPGYTRDDGAAEFKFSFTNEFGIAISCNSTIKQQKETVEKAFVVYQNDLAVRYGCGQEVSYGAAVITTIVDVDSNCGTGTTRNRRGLQYGQRRVNIKYNTLGTCRQCGQSPSRSLPPEDSLGRRAVRGRALQTESRDVFVSRLSTLGVDDAAVNSEIANNCLLPNTCNPPPGLDDGACCGVLDGCSCPSVTDSYCAASNCNLPGGECCPNSMMTVDPLFGSCSWEAMPHTRL